MPLLRKILIANRGEIAVRIMRTCRAMGIETVAVYSDFDANALHVRLADQAVPIGGAAARDSYLNIDALLAAARRCGADAIHPGYGFLAENAGFAAACENADIVFIGPSSKVIQAMGSKAGARRIAQDAGVPVVPALPENDSPASGFPWLIKASAGGGGRGMRIVRSAHEFQESLSAARGEAERAFGDGTLLIEQYIEGARHVEVQIFGDHHGNVMHLFERDCSIQRRHQKIIEESPSPAVTPEIRNRMTEAALALGRAIGYTNAGTVEFLLVPTGEFYFIEVNTRIQVEHPVTEMITGFDLIRLQIEIAQGKLLPSSRPQQNGHAIEVRLYAEDPDHDFLPSTGTLHVWHPPIGIEGLRVDSGVEAGTEIGVYYDPLLAKVIAHAPDRNTAIAKLVYALKNFAAQGVINNRQFLIDVLEHDEFRAGRAHTGFCLPPQTYKSNDAALATVMRTYIERTEHGQRKVLPSIPLRYRNNPYRSPAMKLEINGREYDASPDDQTIEIVQTSPGQAVALIDGIRRHFQIHQHGDEYYVRSSFAQRKVVRMPRYPRRTGAGQHETANSPMPGQILRILVAAGQHVKPGDQLVVLEAMKMEQTIKTTIDGVVKAILVKLGDIVAPGQMLVEIESTENANEHPSSSAASN
ncbi:MAG TPA: biotin carboxylase N-terminal domain-containing protein [Candidatus Angelobacter sp.]|jgi:propionyl-CoA carboxylase alpha chain|nr:biotin carboxylase N-terminal domain-containing protein [Candidatus Angelobacter sp.]